MNVPGEPLVSLLIPGFRTTFLRACLESALAQRWGAMEILVGDDCPDDGVSAIVAEYAARDPRIRLVTFDGRGERANLLALFAEARGELIKFLNDDDLLDERCVQRMASCLISDSSVSLVTSHRGLIDADGHGLPDEPFNRRLVARDSVLEARPLIEEMLSRQINLVGEPTSVMFRRRDLASNEPDIISFAGRRATANGDVSMWVSLLQRGDAIYLADTLSYFRIHDGQRQRVPEYAELGRLGWQQLCADARASGMMPTLAPAGIRSRALGVKPWWPVAARTLGVEIERAADRGRADDLPSLARRLTEMVPGDPTAGTILAMVELQHGKAGEARQRLESLLESSPWNVDARRTLGLALIAAGEVDAAWREMCAALETAPGDEVTHAALAPLAASCELPRPPLTMLRGALDGPVDGVDVYAGVAVRGWVLVHPAALGAPQELKIVLDGRVLESRPQRIPRPDVLANNGSLAPFNPAPGFHVSLVTSELEPGPHTVECSVCCGEYRQMLGRRTFNVLARVSMEAVR